MPGERRFGEDETIVAVELGGGSEDVPRRPGPYLVQVLREAESVDDGQTGSLELALGFVLRQCRLQPDGQRVGRDTDPAIGPPDDLAGRLRTGDLVARGECLAGPLVRPDEYPARSGEGFVRLVVDAGFAHLPTSTASRIRRSFGDSVLESRARLDRDNVVEFFSLDEMATLVVLT
ncbi:hypothetical protein [Streptomyces sp. TE5632]